MGSPRVRIPWGEGCSKLKMLRDEDALVGGKESLAISQSLPNKTKQENKTMDNRFLCSQTPISLGLLWVSIPPHPHIPQVLHSADILYIIL